MAGAYPQASAINDGVVSLESAYEASLISSTSTSQSSVFSSDDVSEQSSVSSSTSDDFRQDDGKDRFSAAALDSIENEYVQQSQSQISVDYAQKAQSQTYASVTSVPTPQRQHPRRGSLARNQKPPPLVRQADRKLNFVDNLVDSATQMVEVIWPLSMTNCRLESGHGRRVLPLRTYIEETLRRSRTSYSTLQVALYYLVLIKPHVPATDPSMDINADHQSNRVLVCGRRMFLAALILASKYLQDRNYSAKAWSKMSGLKVTEINANERIFLDKINWKLHVAKPIFDQWTEVVLKYTPSAHPPSPGCSSGLCWKTLIPNLTPGLDRVPLPQKMEKDVPETPAAALLSPATPTPTNDTYKMNVDTPSEDTTPTPATIAPPRFLEPRPNLMPPTPGLVRMGPLPTPQMTPASVAASTPAASVCSSISRRPSICNAMSMVQRSGMNRCVNDEFPFPMMDKLRMHCRRPSITSVASARSSPESMITDMSRSSRASSISSVTTMSTTSGPAPRRACLARMATTRNVKSSLRLSEEMDGTASRPITIAEEETELELSPIDFAVNEKKLHAPHRHSKHAQSHVQHNASAHHNGPSRKRHRQSRGGRKSDLYDEVRYQLEDEQDDNMIIDLVDSDEDMSSPSPAADQASSFLRGAETNIQVKASQPPASISRSSSGRIPLSRYDGSKRTCFSADNTTTTTNNTILDANAASLYMEIA